MINKIFTQEYFNFSPKEKIEFLKKELLSLETSTNKIPEVKVPMDLLDEFMQMSGEMTVIRNMINKSVRSIEMQYEGNRDVALLGELLTEMHKINSDIQSKITEIRKVTVKSLIDPIIRSVTDYSLRLKKDIELMVEGEKLKLDYSVTDIISNSLMHLIRNLLDNGKKNKGKITLRFSNIGDIVMVEIEDGENEVIELGQLKESIEFLNGKIYIDTYQGRGAIYKIEIPIPKSILITDCLFVQSGKYSFGIPQDNIIRILDHEKIPQEEIMALEGSEVLKLNSRLLPIFSLAKLLGYENAKTDSSKLVVLKTGKLHFVMQVEKVIDVEDTVIKTLTTNLLKNLGIYRGGTFLADGSVGLIFNVEAIAKKLGFVTPIEMKIENVKQSGAGDPQNVVVFELGISGIFCLAEKDILRIENIDKSALSSAAGFQVMPYRESVLTMINLTDLLNGKDERSIDVDFPETIPTIIVQADKSYVGIVVHKIIDLVATDSKIIDNAKKQFGFAGCLIIDGQTVSMINLNELLNRLKRSDTKVDETNILNILISDEEKVAA